MRCLYTDPDPERSTRACSGCHPSVTRSPISQRSSPSAHGRRSAPGRPAARPARARRSPASSCPRRPARRSSRPPRPCPSSRSSSQIFSGRTDRCTSEPSEHVAGHRGAGSAVPPAEPHAAVLDRPGSRFEMPMKPATNGPVGVLVDLLGRAALAHLAALHHRDPVGHRQRLLLVVRHVEEGDPDLALDPLELDLHLLAQLQVERAERLVEQQHRGPVDERPGQRDALLLAARQLARPGLLAARAADELERLLDALRISRSATLRRFSPKATLVARRGARRARSSGRPCSRCAGRAAPSPPARPQEDRPSLGCSKPATIRSVVVLPQPDGPSSEKNSPCLMSRSRSSTAASRRSAS